MPKAPEEQDVEKVHLRKHQFEMNPSNEESEQVSSVTLGKALQTKVTKVKTKKSAKKDEPEPELATEEPQEPKMDDDVLKSVTSDTETEASKSEQGEETMSVQDVKEPRPKEKVKPTANEEKPDQTVSPLDTPSQKESEPEASDVDPSIEEAPASDKVEKAKPQPKKSIEEKIEEKKQ